MAKKIRLFIFLLFFIVVYAGANENKKENKKFKIFPFLDIEHRSFIQTGPDASTDKPTFLGVNNELFFSTGLGIKVNQKLLLQPFFKTYLNWSIEASGTPQFVVDEFSFALALIYIPKQWVKIGFIIANADIFQPDMVFWSGVKGGITANFNKRGLVSAYVKETFKSVFKIDSDSKFKTWLTDQLESQIYLNLFGFTKKKIDFGIYGYNNFVFVSMIVGKGMLAKLKIDNDLFVGIYYKPVSFFELNGSFNYDLSYEYSYSKNSSTSIETITYKTNHEIGFKIATLFTIRWVTIEAAYNPLFYRNISGSIENPSHNFSLVAHIYLNKK